ncbi:MAG: hypothetical protein ACJ8G3_14445 [Burkholderiaceae bacterium]
MSAADSMHRPTVLLTDPINADAHERLAAEADIVVLPQALSGCGCGCDGDAALRLLLPMAHGLIQNTEFFKVLLPAKSQKYGLTRDIDINRDGMVHAPDGLGLGAEIDFALIERKKVAVLA